MQFDERASVNVFASGLDVRDVCLVYVKAAVADLPTDVCLVYVQVVVAYVRADVYVAEAEAAVAEVGGYDEREEGHEDLANVVDPGKCESEAVEGD
jgi:hypothetical protein